jgi:hypothetical protein
MIRAFILSALLLSCYGFFPADIKSPRVPTHSISYEHTTFGNSTWKYRVEHNDNVVSLEFAEGITKATCAGNMLFITFDNQTNAVAFMKHIAKGHIVVGGAHHGCINATTGKRSVIVREIMTVPALSQETISFGTRFGGLTDVLKHAESSMSVNPLELQAMASCTNYDIVAGSCTTTVAQSKSFAGWKWQYSGPPFFEKIIAGGAKSSITCTDCFASFVPSINVNVGIQNNGLSSLEIQVLGTATVQVKIIAGIRNGYSTSGSFPVTKFTLPSVTFFIGAFPVMLDFEIPVTVEWSFSTKAQIVVSTGVTVTDTLMGGMKYDGSNWKSEKSNNFQVSFQKPAASSSAQATFKCGLQPKLAVTFEHVATVGVGIQPYIEIDAAANANTAKLTGEIFGGIEIDVDGNLGVVIDGTQIGPQKAYGPKTVYDYKKSVWKGST